MKGIIMLGLGDFWISLVWVLVILSTLLCVVYGALNWNKESEEDAKILEEEKRWEREEKRIEETL
ncbi:MAG: hypothetical protein ONB24_05140 [candidate division KSB1 bacterium]|nr:hypothetical protein [candidate division KSB1 bacterium]